MIITNYNLEFQKADFDNRNYQDALSDNQLINKAKIIQIKTSIMKMNVSKKNIINF